MARSILLPPLAALVAASAQGKFDWNCAWGRPQDQRCSSPTYAGEYPTCALFQRPDGKPIPCQGWLPNTRCQYEGPYEGTSAPAAASWHLHVLFPNKECPNCTSEFTDESDDFSYEGGMELRGLVAAALNEISAEILGHAPEHPIDVERAKQDSRYDTCESMFHVFSGMAANYHPEPCIFFNDDYMTSGGPFTDPSQGKGYPNWSFFLPGPTWMPALKDKVLNWVGSLKGGPYRRYPVLIHPNTGCLIRDHFEEKHIFWSDEGHPLLARYMEHWNALGDTGACPTEPSPPQPLPANCTWSGDDDEDEMGAVVV